MKKIIALLLALALVIGLVACGAKEEAAAPAETEAAAPAETEAAAPAETEAAPAEDLNETKVLKLGWGAKNDTLSGFLPPMNSGNTLDQRLLFSTLVKYDMENDSYLPELAETWEIAEDGMTYTFHLNENAKWHDGQPVTAEDVVYTLNFIVKNAGADAAKLVAIKGYQDVVDGVAETLAGAVASDDHTVVLELDQANFDLLWNFSCPNQSILPSHLLADKAWADAAVDEAFWANPIGSGPYKINETAYPNYVTLVRNDDYYGGTAKIKNIQLSYYADQTAINAALMAGDLAWATVPSAEDAQTVAAANAGIETIALNAEYCRGLVANLSNLDTARDDLKDPKVRQALNMIIDKQMIVDYMGVIANVATTVCSSKFNADIPVWERDVDTAVQMLKDAGYDFDDPLVLYTNYSDQQSIDIMEMMVASLQEAGVAAEYYIDANNAYSIIYETIDYDFLYGAMGGNDPNAFQHVTPGALYDVWYTEEILAENAERYGKLAAEYKATMDPAKREQIMDQMQIYSMEDMHRIPVWFMATVWVVDTAQVEGYEPVSSTFAWYTDANCLNWSFVQ